METFYEVHATDFAERIPEIGKLIRLSFADVARDFHLTPQNAPTSPAFTSDSGIYESLARPGAACFGALFDDALVGFVAIWPKGDKVYELTRLCVAPTHRHAGLGGRLIDAAVRAAKDHGARRIEIGIIAENTRLKHWYESHGFRATALKEYKHLPFSVCEMERSLRA